MIRPRRFRKRPKFVDAVQWTGPAGNAMEDLLEWGAPVHTGASFADPHWQIILRTPSGLVPVFRGDWIVRGDPNDYYPVKPDAFQQLFEAVE